MVKIMDIRRVQMTGGSSYIITLPKDWVKNLNIQKNDPIGLLQQSDGTLLITSKMNREQTQRIKEFDVTEINNKSYLFRKLIAAYISGYNSIILKSKNRITPMVRVTIRKFTQTTIGQEVVEETDNKIIIKDLLNPAEMPFNRTIKRMFIMIKGMYEDAISALKNNDTQLAEDILTRDNEIDRLNWLVARQQNIILRNINFAEKMGTTTHNATTSFLISRILERIGDHIIKIAYNTIDMNDYELDETIIKKFEKASRLSLELLNKSIGSFFKKDIKEANQNIDNVKELEKLCNEINSNSLTKNPTLSITLGSNIESIKRIGEYSSDISENVINYLIGD